MVPGTQWITSWGLGSWWQREASPPCPHLDGPLCKVLNQLLDPESPPRAFTLHPWLSSDVANISLHLSSFTPTPHPALLGSNREAASGSVPPRAVFDQELVWGRYQFSPSEIEASLLFQMLEGSWLGSGWGGAQPASRPAPCLSAPAQVVKF